MTLNEPESADDSRRRDALRHALQQQLLIDIPITRAMQLEITAWDGESLQMTAPLAPNVNDKGCAFGGSLVSVMTLACWSLIKLAADARELECDIYVQDSSVRYLAPVWDNFTAISRLGANSPRTGFFTTLQLRGRARIAATCEIRLADGTLACTLEARFVALRRCLAPTAANTAQSQPDCQV